MSSDNSNSTLANNRPDTADLPQPFLDSLTDNTVVLDTDGVIVATNEAWRAFGRANGLAEDPSMIGKNYLDVTRGVYDPEGERAIDGIRAVIEGEKEDFEMEYPCHSPDEKRWFLMRAAQFELEGETYVTVTHTNITERKERERDQEQYRTVTKAASDVIVTIDESSTIRRINPAVEDLFGYEPDELLGEDLTVLMPEDYREAHENGLRRYLETGERNLDWDKVTLPGLHADGSEMQLAISFGEVHFEDERYFTGIIRDVTEEEKRKRELRERTEHLHTIIETTPECIKTVAPDGTLLQMNPAGLKMVEADSESDSDVVGKSVYDLIAPEHREKFREFNERICRGERGILEFDIVGREGTRRHMESHGAPVQRPDGMTAHLALTRDITEQKQRKRELETSEERLTQLTEHLETVFWIVDADHSEYEYLSPYFEDLWGRDRNKFETLPEDFLATVHPEDRDRVASQLENQTEGKYEIEYRIQRPNGVVRWIRDRAFPVTDEEGEVVRVAGTSEDVTEDKQQQNELKRKERRYQAVFNDPNILVGLIDTDGTVLDINETAISYIDASINEVRGIPFWETPWFNHSRETRRNVREWVRRAAGGEYVEFEVDLERPNGEPFTIQGVFRPVTNDDGEVVSILVSDRDITERKQMEQALARNEKRFRDMAENINEAFFLTTPDYDEVLYINPPAEDLYRVPLEDLRQDPKAWQRHVHPEDLDRINENIRKGKMRVNDECRLVLNDETRWLQTNLYPIYDEDGSPEMIAGICSDITERKRAEQEIKENAEFLDAINDRLPGVVFQFRVDTDGSFSFPYLSEGYEELTGVAPEEALGDFETAVRTLHPDDREPLMDSIQEAIETQSPWRHEVRFEHPEDGTKWAMGSSRPEQREDGSLVFSGVIIDVTDRKKLERELERKTTRYELAQELANLGHWSFTVADEEATWSDETYRIFGLEPESLDLKLEDGLEYYHPEDRDDARRKLKNAVETKSEVSYEARVVRPDGNVRHISVLGTPRTDGSGTVTALFGAVQDITERKKREKELEGHLAALKAATDGLAILNDKQEYVFMNDSHANIYGFENPEDLIGKSWRVLYDESTIKDFENNLIPQLKRNGSWQGDLEATLSNGEKMYQNLTLTLLPDGRIVCAVRDITERKRAEQELRETEERFRQITENINEVFWLSDPDKTEMIYVSPRYECVWDRPVESVYEDPDSFLKAVHPADRDRVKQALPRQKRGNYDIEYRIQQPNGEIRWIRDQAFPVENEAGEVYRIAGVAEDITEMKNLQRQREKFVELVEHSRNYIARANLDGELTYINQAGLEMIGLEDKEEILGQPITMLHPDENREKHKRIQTQVATEGQWHGERQLVNQATGEHLDVLFDGFIISDPETGEDLEYAAVATDISEQTEVEQQLRKMIEEKEVLLQEVHHRVKNNLQVVLGLLGLQARRLDNADATEALENSRRRIQSMAMIHEKLYEGAHLSSLDFDEYVEDLLDRIVKSQYNGSSPPEIKTEIQPSNLDPDTIISCGLILNELVSNSMKHGFNDVEHPEIEVELFTDDRMNYHLLVSDNGSGVDPEELRDTDTLGMTLVRNLAENQLHGKIKFSQVHGLEVEVVFPPAAARYENYDS